MLAAIRDFFERRIAGAADDERDGGRHSIALATAALLVETVRIDREVTDDERQAVLRAVRERFGLSPQEAGELVGLAEQEVAQATDYFQFTSLINRSFTPEQKNRVIELMWEVALVDDEISAHERHLLRKIADLIHVTHPDYVAAQQRARDRLARR